MGLFDWVVGTQSNGLLGSNPVSRALGISGDQENYWQPGAAPTYDDSAYKALQSGLSKQSPYVDPRTASSMATSQVRDNPVLSPLFGSGGALERAGGEEQRLASQGFQLTPQDREAYGQASGDIARLFGQQEQGLSQSMADRGFGAAGGGPATAAFSGLAGNKNEMLAKAQTDIANQRMQNTMQRLGQTRQFMTQLGGQGENAIQQQFGRNLGGVENEQNALMGRFGAASDKYNSQLRGWEEQNRASLLSLEDQRDNKQPTLMQGLGRGLMHSATEIGSIPGHMASKFAGGGMGGGGGGGGEEAAASGGGGGGMSPNQFWAQKSYSGGGMAPGRPSLFGGG